MSSDALLGTILAERYRLDALLGEGGMGKVYAAQHILMRKRLAVKVLHRQLTQVPEVVRRFEREALAAAHVEHPNIAAATDFGKLSDGSVYLVLEFVEGRSLRDEIAEGPLPVARALHIARQVAAALTAAHHLSIVHRDLKPENVMLVEKGGDRDFVKVLDFGIAKVPIGDEGDGEGKPITKAGMVYGTPEYMAPEQALGQSVDGRADLYALGVILYEMLAGVRPFGGKSQVGILGQQLTQPAPGFAQRAPGSSVPPAVESLVLRMLAREADERCQSAGEVLSSLEALLGTLPTTEDRLFTLFGGSPTSVVASREAVVEPGAALREPGVVQAAADREALVSRENEPRPPGTSVLNPARELLLRTRERWASQLRGIMSALGAQVHSIAAHLEARKSTLPPRFRGALRRVSGRMLLAGVGASVLCLAAALLALFVLVRKTPPAEAVASAAEPAEASGPVARSPSDQTSLEKRLDKAEAGGIEALESLAKQESTEGLVFVALASARAKESDFSGALEAVSQALALDPKLHENPRIASVLFRGAQAADSSAAAFRLLRGPMGTRGADIIYDLAHTRGVRQSIKDEAMKIVLSEDFHTRSSPALAVALDLKAARSCTQYAELLERAQQSGDARALASLRPLTATTGCGPKKQADCYACLRDGERLSRTIETIEKRTAAPPDAAPASGRPEAG